MGTPGDRSRFKNISEPKPLQLEDHKSKDEDVTPSPSTSQKSSAPSTATAPSTSMTVITHLPHFSSSFEKTYKPSTVVKHEPLPIASSQIKSEPLDLEQTYIDDFYPEHKFSHTNVFSAVDLQEAGPSGLQSTKTTTKTKQCIHTSKKQKKSTLKKQQQQQQQLQQYVCSVCQKCFQSPSKLAKHQQQHASGSPFKCEHCKKSFSSKFKLVRHALIHSDRKPFSCTICERTFHRKDHLKNHIKVHSPCKQVHVCEKATCKKEYTSMISYRKHLAFHAAEDGSLDCLMCEKSFKSKEDILYHLKVHSGSRTIKNPDEKKYSCDHCQHKFFTRKDVRRHMVVHTGRRDFLCQFCPQRFGRKDHLVRHIKKSHSKTMREETVVKSEPEPEPEAEGDEEAETDGQFDLESILRPLLTQPHTQGELADLGCEILNVIPDPLPATPLVSPIETVDGALFEHGATLNLEDTIISYLGDGDGTVRENTPLPAFSQIFQHQPHPPSPR